MDLNGSKIELKPSEFLVMKEDGKMYTTEFDSVEILGWKEKKIVFHSLDPAKGKAEKRYGVKVGHGEFDSSP